MTETAKTLTFLGVAILVMIVAVATLPRPPKPVEDETYQVLNPVEDPLAAEQLDITEFDEDNATLRTFKVAKVDGRWSIPSHDNYPADAEQQMGDAAVATMNLKILQIASDRAGDHELYGVIDPDPDTLDIGQTGVGTRVTLRDGEDKELVNMVIGKEVKDQAGQRYVRVVGKDPVYVVEVDPGKLSTDFADWIEKDLLKLTPFDIRQVQLNDYSADVQIGPGGYGLAQDKRSQIKLEYDDEKSEWKVAEFKAHDKATDQLTVVEVPKDEELDSVKLNDMKTALDDLKIVNVARKPAGLSQDLKAQQEFVTNQQAARSLQTKGFIPVQIGNQIEIRSSEGEAICTMKDGVEYVLRFGNSIRSREGNKKDKAGDGDEKAGAEDNSNINRYLFVTARYNPDMIPEPEYKPLPGEDDGAKTEEIPAAKTDDTSAPEQKPAAKDAKPESKPDGEADEQPEQKPASDGAQDASAKDDAADDDEAAGDAQTDAPKGDTGQPKAKDGAETKDKPDTDAESKPADADKQAIDEKREAIEKENKRLRDEYDEKVKKAKEQVTELNDRFGDWYYVIADDVYKKIHLGRKDIFKKKELTGEEKKKAAEENQGDGTGLDALEKLQKEGLKGTK